MIASIEIHRTRVSIELTGRGELIGRGGLIGRGESIGSIVDVVVIAFSLRRRFFHFRKFIFPSWMSIFGGVGCRSPLLPFTSFLFRIVLRSLSSLLPLSFSVLIDERVGGEQGGRRFHGDGGGVSSFLRGGAFFQPP